MSRTSRWTHITTPEDFEICEILETFGSSTSRNVTKKLRLKNTRWDGTFYFKTHANPILTRLEAVMTLLAPGVTQSDVLLLRLNEGNDEIQLGLVTRDIKAYSIYDIFREDARKTAFTDLCKEPPESMLNSFADCLIHTWLIANDDCHASNLFFDFSKQRFRVIDFDSTDLFKSMMLKSHRRPNYSQLHWNEITADTIETFGTQTHPLPHYHPLHMLGHIEGAVTSSSNHYNQEMHNAFNHLITAQSLHQILSTKLLMMAILGLPELERWCDLFDISEAHKKRLCGEIHERHRQLRLACQQANRFKQLLLDRRTFASICEAAKQSDDTYTSLLRIIEPHQNQLATELIIAYLNHLVPRLSLSSHFTEGGFLIMNQLAIDLLHSIKTSDALKHAIELINKACSKIKPDTYGLHLFSTATAIHAEDHMRLQQLSEHLQTLTKPHAIPTTHLASTFNQKTNRWQESVAIRSGYVLYHSSNFGTTEDDDEESEVIDASVIRAGIERPSFQINPCLFNEFKGSPEEVVRQAIQQAMQEDPTSVSGGALLTA